MTLAVVVLGVCLICSLAANVWGQYQARTERADLADRVMALSQPISLITHRTPSEPSEVAYIDEAREAELSPAWSPDGSE